MRTFLLGCLMIFAINGFSQNPEAEKYRFLGYQARINGKSDSAVFWYSKVLDLNGFDYDAHLALARLYFYQENYQQSIFHYRAIYQTDTTDAEALLGFARIFFREGDFVRSGYYYDLALQPKEGFLPFYLERARTLIYQDKLDSAIMIYEKAIQIDQTLAEAWAGIGKMYYWQNKPFSALPYIRQARKLDPENEETERIFRNLQRETTFTTQVTLRSVTEAEESYRIKAIIGTVSASKRFSNNFYLSLNLLNDVSNKAYEWTATDTQRLFTNFRLNAAFMGKKNKLTVFTGYSSTDRVFSSYGASYLVIWRIKRLKFYNALTAAYDYFYYWNQVGQDYFTDNLSVLFKKLNFQTGFRYGIIRKNQIADFEHQKYDLDINPYYTYSFSVRYRLWEKPSLNLGLNYSYMDFTYNSPLYYTPKGRNLSGLSVGIYQSFLKEKVYFYGAANYNIGREKYYEESAQHPGTIESRILKVDNINWETEAGYHFREVSLSAGYSGFINPYYKNRVIFASVLIYL